MAMTPRTIWETRPERQTADERLVARLTESPAQRARRVARRVVDPETAAALRRLWAA